LAEEPKKGKAAEASKKPTAKGAASKKGPAPDRDKQPGDEPDALMTTTLKAMEWAQKRRKQIVYTVGGIAVVVGGWFGWGYYRGARELAASDLLAKGVMAEFAPIKTGDEEANDAKRIAMYASEDEKEKAALAAYAETKAKYGDTGPGVLARLGEAGVYLDRHEWDSAIAAYTDVRNHPLANADSNIRLRCIEGLGYAREGKGSIDEARKSFDELMNLEAKSAKPLGLYHLARLDAQQGKNPDAITKLKAARDAISQPGAPSSRYLHDNIEKLLGRLDPTSVHKAPPAMPGGMQGLPPGMSLEQLKALMGKQGGRGALPPGLPPGQ
jgi:hypothetical protein